MITLRSSDTRDTARILEIWRKAVDATHDFLHPADRITIEEEVTAFLPEVPLTLAVDASDQPLGFMFLHEGHMEALFIDPDHHGKGTGKALVQAALAAHPALTTDVNEQNAQAMGFYRRLGFEPTGRSDLDGQGRPYPLVHLQFRATEK
ncbi:acetyltransferase [Agrobacterium arsenijevicii]|uniref:Acetyltransferase n=1 Tax=Agrobacterium arsenijevicii TaxID=1585697 RepID=A0ABR5DD08_9HYPH|nr:acetyltransferase [Agrobacterium arsenijevicii]